MGSLFFEDKLYFFHRCWSNFSRKWYVHIDIYGKRRGVAYNLKNSLFFPTKNKLYFFFPLRGKKIVQISTKYKYVCQAWSYAEKKTWGFWENGEKIQIL